MTGGAPREEHDHLKRKQRQETTGGRAKLRSARGWWPYCFLFIEVAVLFMAGLVGLFFLVDGD